MSAYIVSKEHIDYLITAGFHLPGMRRSMLHWLIPREAPAEAYQRGEPWGPEAISDCNERRRELSQDHADEVGRMLWAENQESVNHRYDDEEIEEIYFYKCHPDYEIRHAVNPIETLKALSCYEYQTCEHPEWENSEAFTFCEALRSAAIRALPGYEEAEWGAPVAPTRPA